MISIFYSCNVYGHWSHDSVSFDIYFDENSFEINDDSKKIIDSIGLILQDTNTSRYGVSIFGYTDSIGSEYDNQLLSTKRAKAVYDYLLSKKNTDSAFIKLLEKEWFPSVCHDIRFDSIPYEIPIAFTGKGVHPDLKEPSRIIENIEKYRKVSIVIFISTPVSWGVIGPDDTPSSDTFVIIPNGIIQVSQGSIKTTDNIKYPPKKKTVENISVQFIQTKGKDLFSSAIQQNDTLFLILGKYIVTDFPTERFYAKCENVVDQMPPIYLTVPLTKFQSREELVPYKKINRSNFQIITHHNPFSNTRMRKPPSVPDSIDYYLQIPISKNHTSKYWDNYLNGDTTKRPVKSLYYTTDVIRDTIFIVKKIAFNEISNATITYRGSKEPDFSLSFPFYEDLKDIEFKRTKNYLLFFKQYQCETQMYGDSKNVYLHSLNSKGKSRKKRINLFEKGATGNKYLIKRNI